MKKLFSILLAVSMCSVMLVSSLVTASAKFDQEAAPEEGDTVAILHTNYGDIAMSFFADDAPKGVENFITLAEDGKYDNTIFHRVIDDFMIQGGDYTNSDGTGGESCWGEDFENECVDRLSNIRGAVSYANRGEDTNSSQFFINSVDNDNLDGSYTVFGQVFAGMDVVDLISDCEKSTSSSGEESVPVNEVKLESVEITEYEDGMEDELAAAVDPYADSETEAETEAATTADDTTETTAENNFDPTAIIVIAVVVVVIGGICVVYVVYESKQKKKRAAQRAEKMAHKKKKKKK